MTAMSIPNMVGSSSAKFDTIAKAMQQEYNRDGAEMKTVIATGIALCENSGDYFVAGYLFRHFVDRNEDPLLKLLMQKR